MTWRAQVEEEWKTTAQYRKVNFITVYVPNQPQVIEPSFWPAPYRWVLGSFMKDLRKWSGEHWRGYGELSAYISPRFFVIHQGEIRAVSTGTRGWQGEISPVLTGLVGR